MMTPDELNQLRVESLAASERVMNARLTAELAQVREAMRWIPAEHINAFIRAFWRRVYGYRNKYERELPEKMPVEFRAAAETAMLVFPKTAQPDIAAMVDRFLCWKLPQDFQPDAGIVFHPPKQPYATPCWPTGTNLFTAAQAKAMIEHLLQSPPSEPQWSADNE